MTVTLIVVASVALAGVLALWIGAWRQQRSTARLVEELLQPSLGEGSARVDFDTLEGLPAPVARYLRHVLRDGQPCIRVVRLSQVGVLRTDARSDRWLSFEANQTIAPWSPGFVWEARVAILPFLHLRVRDAYLRGQGSGRVSLLSAVTVAAQSGRHEVDSGSLHRYLAEAVWCPTALLPSAALQWSPISDTKALATLTHAGTTVSLEFWFNDVGMVAGIYSPGRWGRFDGGYSQTPWEGHFRHYCEQDGMLVPSEGEVGWYLSGEWQCVWKGQIVAASYAFAR